MNKDGALVISSRKPELGCKVGHGQFLFRQSMRFSLPELLAVSLSEVTVRELYTGVGRYHTLTNSYRLLYVLGAV
jgi:hypothetical protein